MARTRIQKRALELKRGKSWQARKKERLFKDRREWKFSVHQSM
jgi:hypothetical protein